MHTKNTRNSLMFTCFAPRAQAIAIKLAVYVHVCIHFNVLLVNLYYIIKRVTES